MVDEATALPEDPGSLRELVVSLREEARERSAERDLAYEALKLKTLEVEKRFDVMTGQQEHGHRSP